MEGDTTNGENSGNGGNSDDNPGDQAKRAKPNDTPMEGTSSVPESPDDSPVDSVAFNAPSNSRSRNYRNSHESIEDDDMALDEVEEEEEEDEDSSSRDQIDDDSSDSYVHWYGMDHEDDDDDLEGDDDDLSFSLSDGSSDSTVVQDSDNESDIEEHPLFKKEKPKHQWSAIKEIEKRQLGSSAKLPSREMFQRRCYGSLHCVSRLELMYKLEEHSGCVNCLNFHHDGTLLASGSDDLKIVIWDWKVGKSLLKFKTKHRSNIFQSKFLHLSGDLHIASCARDGQVRYAQVGKEEGIKSARLLGSHRGACHKLIILPEQPHLILSAGEDGVVLSHDVRNSKSTKIVTAKASGKVIPLYSIHGHPLKTQEFCVSGKDAAVRVYDQRKSSKPIGLYSPFKKTRPSREHVTCAVYNYNGSEILASYSNNDVYLFDGNVAEWGKYIHQYQGHRNSATIKGVNFFGPKSEYVVSGSDCGHIYFWERNSEALVQWLLADDNGVVNCLEPHPQLPFICTSGLDWDVKVWVPSCEEEPRMDGLSSTVRRNFKKGLQFVDMSNDNEGQMLWMLQRMGQLVAANALWTLNSSSSDVSTTNSDVSDEDLPGGPDCRTS